MIFANIILILFIILITLLALIVLMNYKLIIINNTDSTINTYRERKLNYE